MAEEELAPILEVPFPPELESEGLATVECDGREIVLLKMGDTYRGVDRFCPHEEGDLGEGLMFGKNIKCPVHGYIYDLNTGKCINRVGASSTRLYDVEVKQGVVFLRLRGAGLGGGGGPPSMPQLAID